MSIKSPYLNPDLQPEHIKKLNAGREKNRKCLRCREKFLSHGPEIRLCPTCYRLVTQAGSNRGAITRRRKYLDDLE
jgi:hypothetical protein